MLISKKGFTFTHVKPVQFNNGKKFNNIKNEILRINSKKAFNLMPLNSIKFNRYTCRTLNRTLYVLV
jgi:hypothetical protein